MAKRHATDDDDVKNGSSKKSTQNVISSSSGSSQAEVAQPPPCTNPLITPLLTDMYQISMSLAYFKSKSHLKQSTFELFFRKAPFKGEFCVFAGLDQVLSHLSNFKFTDDQLNYVRELLPEAGDDFFDYLRGLTCDDLEVTSVLPGALVFPRVPLITVSGPLGLCQLLETTLLTLINYPTLIATNAARFRLASGAYPTLLEFGLRRAQGPDGGYSASKYAILGGFDGTSNVTAGWMEKGLKVSGTMAHSYVMSFKGWDGYSGDEVFREEAGKIRDKERPGTNEGELRSFVEYAQCFPSGFLALIDTYDTIGGVYNFCSVAVAMGRKGLKPVGIRLDSGDLAYLSRECRKVFDGFKGKYPDLKFWDGLQIVASNDINEEVLVALGKQSHCITAYGIGTNLVTCQAQPALGCVYKLVEVEGEPRIKLSQDIEKVLIPGRKNSYRLIGSDGSPLLDLMIMESEAPPTPGTRILARHPFEEQKRCFVTPTEVVLLSSVIWKDGVSKIAYPTIQEARQRRAKQIDACREDHLRHHNPTPYKVSVSDGLYKFLHKIWMEEAPVVELS